MVQNRSAGRRPPRNLLVEGAEAFGVARRRGSLRLLLKGCLRREVPAANLRDGGGNTGSRRTCRLRGARFVGNAVVGTCVVFNSDLKVRIDATDLSTFPDATVVYGERQLSSLDRNAVTNPTLLVEVTSPSTEDYDRGDKLSHYKQLPSLRAVLIVSHRRARVTVIERTADGWREREFRAGDVLTLDTPSLTIPIDELYAGIELTPA